MASNTQSLGVYLSEGITCCRKKTFDFTSIPQNYLYHEYLTCNLATGLYSEVVVTEVPLYNGKFEVKKQLFLDFNVFCY